VHGPAPCGRRLTVSAIKWRAYSWRTLATIGVFLMVSASGAGERNSFPSPDGSLTAIVKEIGRAGIEGMRESAVEMRRPGGVVLLRQAYVSKDGEHGYDVAQAEWTADSGYFLYVTQSSGGH
jgi:hypothetical protein